MAGNKPHTCPVCGGEGKIAIGGSSTSCIPLTKPCVPCKGQGIIWGPEGSDKNWTNPSPINPFDPIIEPYFPPIQDPMELPDLEESRRSLQRSIEDHIKQLENKSDKQLLKEEKQDIRDIIKEPLPKRFVL